MNTNYDSSPRGIHYRLPHHFPITLAGWQEAAIYQLNVFPPLCSFCWWSGWVALAVIGKMCLCPQRHSGGSGGVVEAEVPGGRNGIKEYGGGGRDSNQTIQGGWQFRDGDN